jgi:hypothetical protein
MKPRSAHLEQIQRWMQSVITHPGGVEEGVDAEETRRHLDVPLPELDSVIRPSKALGSEARLEIYVDAYYERLLECLRTEFCGTQYALDEELFDAVAFGYLQHYPSRSYTLGQLGVKFAEYLEQSQLHAQTAPDNAPASWPEFVVELARFERVQREVFDAEGTERGELLDVEALGQLPPEAWPTLRLTVAPCLRLFRAEHPVHEYWQDFRAERKPAAPKAKRSWVAVSRRDYQIERIGLCEVRYLLLESLASGENLSAAIAAALSATSGSIEDLLPQVGDWFRMFARQGLFTAISLA